MKKLILSMAMIAAGAASYAQIGQGSLMLGGDLGISMRGEETTKFSGGGVSTETKTDGSTNWFISPRIGYFVTDKLAVGVDLSFGQGLTYNQNVTNGSTTESVKSFDMNIGVFGRYYIDISDNFYFYGQARVGFRNSSYTERDPDPLNANGLTDGDKVTNSGLDIGITPGLTYFPSPKWGVDFNLGGILNLGTYNTKRELAGNAGTAESSRTDFDLGFGLNPTLGLHYYMGRSAN